MRPCSQEEYFRQGKKGRGAIRTYMQKVTGRSRAQITRLIGLYRKTGELKSRAGRRHRFARKYTAADILLLAVVDRAHERLSGPATRHVLEREYKVYGKREFARLAEISVSHLYNLRATAAYRRRAAVFVPTRPTAIPIGERRRPDPRGEPGHLRVDSVHQGDSDGVKGVFHINAVDEVTQWEVVGCAEGISERFLIPVLKRCCISSRSAFWLSFRQRFGVRQLHGGQAVEQAVDRVHRSRRTAVRTTGW